MTVSLDDAGHSFIKYSPDVYALNTGTLEWVRLQQRGEQPKARAYHAAAVVGNFLVVLGERESATHRARAPSSLLSPLPWPPDHHPLVLSSRRVPRPLLSPRPRYPRTLTASPVCCVGAGGWSGACENLATLSTLDLDGIGTWASVAVPGQPPTGGYGHSATVLGSNILTFGGWDGTSPISSVNVLDTTKL
jgi:hypothetical protein